MYKPVAYANQNVQGPSLVVIPGEFKSVNVSFSNKITPNNIADWGELELTKANFQVLERSDLGPMLEEIALAANMGDTKGLQKFRKGKFETTKWFIKFDILKAEPVASVQQGFDGRALGAIAGGVLGQTVGYGAGYAAEAGVGSIHSSEAAGIWIVGMRYKILDASTGQQVSTGYFEEKMELGAKSGGALGFSQSEQHGVSLDTMSQRLVQRCVQEIDRQK
ncbi:hypothetical protein JCM14635_34630 [Megalodesulfovibrio paquesii]